MASKMLLDLKMFDGEKYDADKGTLLSTPGRHCRRARAVT